MVIQLFSLHIKLAGLAITWIISSSLTTDTKHSARNLEGVFNQYHSFNQHIKSLVQSCSLLIRNIAKVKPKKHRVTTSPHLHFLPTWRFQLIIYLLKVCSSHQLVKNTSARLPTNTHPRELITPVTGRNDTGSPFVTESNLRLYWLLLNSYMICLHFIFQNSSLQDSALSHLRSEQIIYC